MTTRNPVTTRRPHTFRKDFTVIHADLRLARARQHQEWLRAEREADRLAFASAAASRHRSARSIRSRVGRSIIRLGRRVAGEGAASPAWTG
jgi:hypothetical protein